MMRFAAAAAMLATPLAGCGSGASTVATPLASRSAATYAVSSGDFAMKARKGLIYVADGTRRETLEQMFEIREMAHRLLGENLRHEPLGCDGGVNDELHRASRSARRSSALSVAWRGADRWRSRARRIRSTAGARDSDVRTTISAGPTGTSSGSLTSRSAGTSARNRRGDLAATPQD